MLHRLRIGQRLAAGFGLVLLVLAILAAVAGLQIGRLAANTDYFVINLVPSYEAEHAVSISISRMRRAELRHALAAAAGEKDEIEARFVKARGEIDVALKAYEDKLVSDDTDRRLLQETKAAVQAYADKARATIAMSRQVLQDPTKRDAVQHEANDGESRRLYEQMQAKADAWWDYNVKLAAEQSTAASDTHRSANITMLVLTTFALLAGGLAAWVITRSIVRPLAEAVRLTQRVAQGDLTAQVQAEGRDEVADLLRSLQAMNGSLVDVVLRVRQSSDSIATGSSQIAIGNADLSQRTEEQASNLQQTTASMMEMNGAVQRSSATAQQATTLADSASAAAQQGGEVVGRVVATMEDIASSSRKIADIITVIDGIAFQTNILALNAAVEAARAGEQGRGFAVVAGEVRTLAQRSAEAAKEIRSLIQVSVENVDNGSRLVVDAGTSMEAIVAQVRQVSELITQMHSSAREQAAGIGQVNDAMSQLDQVTQQNAALVEESAAAAESLKQQAAQLETAVGVFRIA